MRNKQPGRRAGGSSVKQINPPSTRPVSEQLLFAKRPRDGEMGKPRAKKKSARGFILRIFSSILHFCALALADELIAEQARSGTLC